LVVGIVTTFSSCKGQDKSTDTSDGEEDSQNQITLTFANDYTEQNRASDENAKLFYEMLDQFKKDNPNIQFDITEISQDNYQLKYKLKIPLETFQTYFS
jgi:ABC-type glycerol-3-phosphate transport system substrate-binding protein